MVETGNFFDNRNDKSSVKALTALKAMKAMAYDAINIGHKDLSFGLDYLLENNAQLKLPLISSNLKILGSDSGFIKKYLIVEKNGFSVAVLGVMSGPTGKMPKKTISASGYKILPPEKAIVNVLQSLPDKVDFMVLLSHLDIHSTKLLGQKISGINLSITYGESDPSHNDCNEEGLLETNLPNIPHVISADSKGESLGRLSFKISPAGGWNLLEIEKVSLDDSVPHDPNIDELIQSTHKEWRKNYIDHKHEQYLKNLQLTPQEYFEKYGNNTNDMPKDTIEKFNIQHGEKAKRSSTQ